MPITRHNGTHPQGARAGVLTPQSLLPRSGLVLSAEEVRQLWSFVHGDIMNGGLRRYLRGSLGLCPRHAWGHAVVEIELWQAGAGLRGGHQPFDVCILLEDLLNYVSLGLDRGSGVFRRHPENILRSLNPCRICKEVAGPATPGLRMGYANSNTAALTDEANLLDYTRRWCTETADEWGSRACPACTAKDPQTVKDLSNGEVGGRSLLCRHHLLAAGTMNLELRCLVVQRLVEIRRRLLRLIDSMTDTGAPATAADNASWIEALGWFAGWSLPLYLTEITIPPSPSPAKDPR
ncbi:hypothetical protein [Arthrobacter cryoconiti]|uniref:Uncharacterized protein n=1 Tax=Arthrobacter cryoconiti TaxID=748907 RepID=A0ABV8R1M7_9MICC|nr:hypothetical protein [Arthrobacter cryoconiti]MCC9069943.1 hypothetical protein [Arthrobacter cryoconiti]